MSPADQPSRGGRVLVDDVLRKIAVSLPLAELARVNSANSVFHSVYLQAEYGHLIFSHRGKDTKRKLLHLGDPDIHVARWVKSLEMQPWLVEPRTKSPRSATENILIWCSQLIDPDYTKKVAELRLQKRLSKDTQRAISAFKQMDSLEEYNIYWDDNPQYHPELYRIFLGPTINLWTDHLVKLTIKVPPIFLNSLAPILLPKLESLCFTFSTGNLPSAAIENAHDGFIVFVNNTKPTLKSLSFTSTKTSEHLDMSLIFHRLGLFPNLRVISISIPYDGGHLSNPINFVEFLSRNGALLRELNLFTNLLSLPKEAKHHDIEWIQHILDAIRPPLPRLRRFSVALRPIRHPLDASIKFLAVHPEVTSLKLLDRCLTAQELSSILAADSRLAQNLGLLHIKVDTLVPDVLVSIARMCPKLETLQLECQRLMVYRPGVMTRNADGTGYVSDWSVRLQQPSVRHIMQNWKLQTLSLSLPNSNFSQVKTIETDLRNSIPTLARITDLKTSRLPYGQFIY